jgi:hypothetical protein
LDFSAPSITARMDIINAYCDRLGADAATRAVLVSLAPRMDHPFFTPDYIKDVVEKALVMDTVDLLEYVSEITFYLKGMEEN